MKKPLLTAATASALSGYLALLGADAAFAQVPATTSPTATEPATLERFEVTGSRIKRIDTETPQPVVRMTDAEFRATGFTTVGDAIRAMPAISGTSLLSVDAGTSFTPGVSSFNLRGLGNNNTLVLINGRRAAPYGTAGFNGFQVVFDLNSIPVSAIESMEVLKDGASAIYGSDAVAGVLNVVLKKNYTGVATEVMVGNTVDTDSLEKGAFLMFGTSANDISLLTTVDWRERKSIYGRDLEYTDTADGRGVGGFDQRSSAGPIAGVRGLADRDLFPAGTAFFPTPTTNPTLAQAVPGVPLYNFQERAGLFPDERQFGFYTRATYDITPTFTAFAELAFRRSEVKIDSAPTPLFTLNEQGDSPAGRIVFPSTNPFNPFGQDILDLRWRAVEVGNRIHDVTTDTPRILVGLGGDLPVEDWSWEIASLYNKSTTTNISRNNLQDRLVQDAMNGVTIDGTRYFFNPFGPNPEPLLDYLRITNPTKDYYQIRSSDLTLSGPVFTLPAGRIGFAAGAEHRTEKMENIRTALNRTGQLVSGGEGSGTAGDRKVDAFFAELTIPIARAMPFASSLEVQLAARHEKYSDFGRTTKPKIAAIYRPFDEVLIRGSWGKSFLAPNLPFLYTAQSTGLTPQFLADPLRPNDPRNQIKQLGGGNPGLQPEETEVHYAGLVYQPWARRSGSIFRELSFGVDYFRYKQDNLISRLSASQILGDLNQFGNLLLRNPPAPGETVGTIDAVITTWQNLDSALWTGYDFNTRWILPRREWGQLRMDLSATYMDDYVVYTRFGHTDLDGNYNYPLWRGNATLAWNWKDWAASMYVTYIKGYRDNFADPNVPDIGDQFVFNPQVAFRGFRGTTVTLGARNVFNRAPPVDPSDTKLANENINLIEPLFWYVRLSREW